MPELPEVEIVVQCLKKIVSGRRIEFAELRRIPLVPDCSPSLFAKRLKGAEIIRIDRRGKFILFEFDNKRTLITHLRMSGRFMLLDHDEADPKFSHAVFHFSGGERMVFQDQRHFGLMKICDSEALFELKELVSLAPEPFSDEFNDSYFYSVLKRSKRPIKLLLLDQTRVCGVGNIYASEALFLAGIRPKTPACRISKRRASLLRTSILDVLQETLELGKRMTIDKTNIGGNIYGNDADGDWRVYGREGKECVICGSIIARITQGTRSTFYCRKCQFR